MVGDASGPRPGPRDYGWGLLACFAGLMLLASVISGSVALFADGLSVEWVAGVPWLFFWVWIAAGAWRRTAWSTTR